MWLVGRRQLASRPRSRPRDPAGTLAPGGAASHADGTTTAARRPLPPEQGIPADCVRFVEGARSLVGIDLSAHRAAQMERRLRTFAQRRGCKDLDACLELTKRDAAARNGFLDRMTINASELLRDPESVRGAGEDPPAGPRGDLPGGIRAWSAGCSHGGEPCTLSLILQELSPAGRHDLLASDLDQVILGRARGAGWPPPTCAGCRGTGRTGGSTRSTAAGR